MGITKKTYQLSLCSISVGKHARCSTRPIFRGLKHKNFTFACYTGNYQVQLCTKKKKKGHGMSLKLLTKLDMLYFMFIDFSSHFSCNHLPVAQCTLQPHFSLILVGSFDTPAASVTKQTYFPSLLYFHEEIMLAMNVPPSIPKTKPERRDLMLKEVEKFAGWGVDKSLANVKMNWMDRIYLSVSNYVDRVVRFLRIDKL